MLSSRTTRSSRRAAVILGGGEGERLRSLTTQISGIGVPKQFCPVIGRSTLYEQTVNRALLSIEQDRILTVVTRSQERFYRDLVGHLPAWNLVEQPEGRGTGAAILYALLRLHKSGTSPALAIFPSDHFVSHDEEFMRQVEMAFDVVEADPTRIVVLGIKPDTPETEYGWIEPGQRVGQSGIVFTVRQFWEKPDTVLARDLKQRGCLWNSFVIVADASALLRLYDKAVPRVLGRFIRATSAFGTPLERLNIERLYCQLPPIDFSKDLLAGHCEGLTVLPVKGVHWSDLGLPERVFKVRAFLKNPRILCSKACCTRLGHGNKAHTEKVTSGMWE